MTQSHSQIVQDSTKVQPSDLSSNLASKGVADGVGDILFAKQPILDADLNLAAYELLFRGDFDAVTGEEATATVLFNAFSINQFLSSENTPFFINFRLSKT